MLEPIWQVMPNTKADGVWTTHGDLALPLLSTERELRSGDVLWTDVSITYGGYCSDFGRTWTVGTDPDPRQQANFRRWCDIMTAVEDEDTVPDAAGSGAAGTAGSYTGPEDLVARDRDAHPVAQDWYDDDGQDDESEDAWSLTGR